jgi:hypothetical protein
MSNSETPPAPGALQTASSARALHGAERSACADRYDSHDGRYSPSLATQMVRLATITSRQRGLDVGCGPGALSSALAGALDPENIAAIDPHEPFVKSCRERIPGADVRRRRRGRRGRRGFNGAITIRCLSHGPVCSATSSCKPIPDGLWSHRVKQHQRRRQP